MTNSNIPNKQGHIIYSFGMRYSQPRNFKEFHFDDVIQMLALFEE